jgi:hypothetical protein
MSRLGARLVVARYGLPKERPQAPRPSKVVHSTRYMPNQQQGITSGQMLSIACRQARDDAGDVRAISAASERERWSLQYGPF